MHDGESPRCFLVGARRRAAPVRAPRFCSAGFCGIATELASEWQRNETNRVFDGSRRGRRFRQRQLLKLGTSSSDAINRTCELKLQTATNTLLGCSCFLVAAFKDVCNACLDLHEQVSAEDRTGQQTFLGFFCSCVGSKTSPKSFGHHTNESRSCNSFGKAHLRRLRLSSLSRRSGSRASASSSGRSARGSSSGSSGGHFVRSNRRQLHSHEFQQRQHDSASGRTSRFSLSVIGTSSSRKPDLLLS